MLWAVGRRCRGWCWLRVDAGSRGSLCPRVASSCCWVVGGSCAGPQPAVRKATREDGRTTSVVFLEKQVPSRGVVFRRTQQPAAVWTNRHGMLHPQHPNLDKAGRDAGTGGSLEEVFGCLRTRRRGEVCDVIGSLRQVRTRGGGITPRY